MGLLSFLKSLNPNLNKSSKLDAGEITINSTGQKIAMPVDMLWAFKDGEYYERNVTFYMDRLFKKYNNPVFFDIGANYGYYSVKYAHCCNHVFSFEPVSKTHEVLVSNIRRNALKNVTVFKFGLSNKEQELNINLYSSSGNNSIFERNIPKEHSLKKIGQERIHLFSLDSLFTSQKISGPDIIKIDVEGAELNVLEGSLETIKKFSPAIVIEYSETTSLDAGYPKEALLNKLRFPSYTVWGIPDDPNDFRLVPENDFNTEKISNLLILPSNIDLLT